jgi:HD-GYP domain-containing protein (c-di-GMP phosphodiesterase class II)
MIGYVASVHDVGMATVGEDVLSGARKLDDQKRAAIEEHGERGVEIMRPLEVVGAVREMILTHHEWWNGSGYPRGLRGEQIPVGARILSVVDAFESMTAGRAYRPARTGREALEEIQSLAGQQFDPAVVEALSHALHVAELGDETEPGSIRDEAPQVSAARR